MKLFKTAEKEELKNQSGNAILAIFAAVAVIGTIGGSAAILIQGPLKTMGEVNQTTMTEGYLFSAGKMILLDAENWTASGDCDGDRIVEPRPWRAPGALPAPTNGGLIPNQIGSIKRDPWGTQLGYCGWDHGSLINGVTATGDECTDVNRLQGANRRDYPAVVVLSAGPDKTFQSACNNYVDTTPADGEADTPLFVPVGDDMYVVYSYAEAAQELPSIWIEDSPAVWSLNIDGGNPELVATDDVEFSGTDIFAPTRVEMVGQLGLLLPDETELTSCTIAEEGQMRRNMSGATPVLEICESTSFQAVSSGSGGTPPAISDGLNIIGPNDGLVGYWRMDEISGTDVIDSISGNNATMQGAMSGEASAAIGQIGTSLQFERNDNDEILLTNIYTTMSSFSVCFWTFFKESASPTGTFFTKNASGGNEWEIEHSRATGSLIVRDLINGSSAVQITTPMEEHSWHHICAGINENNNNFLYLNGRLIDDSVTATGIWSDAIGDISIGSNSGGFRHLDGYMDDLRLYNRGLSLNEVQAIYNKDNYISQATIQQTGTASDTIGSYSLSIIAASDTLSDAAGIAFKINDPLNPIAPPSAGIIASRIATPARADLLFKTYAAIGGYQTRMTLDTEGGLIIGDGSTLEADLQIGNYAGGWNDDYRQGLLSTNDSFTDQSLTFFGDQQTDDATTQLLFSNMLRLQHTNTEGTTLNEYLRFSSASPQIRAFGDIEMGQENAGTALRVKHHSGTASDTGEFIFQRRNNTARLSSGFNIGQIRFRGYDGSEYTSGANAIIQAFITSDYSDGTLPPMDMRFETRSDGTTGQEHLRLKGSTGQVGFNKASPEARFHVGGRMEITEGFIIGDDTVCASARDEGTLRYRSGAYEICDGTDWIAAGGNPSDSVCKGIPFDFSDRDSLSASAAYDTNSILIGGIKGECPFTVASNETGITLYKNGSAESGLFTTVKNGDRIYLEITSDANPADYVSANITMGEQYDEVHFQTAGKIAFVTSEISNGKLGGYNGGVERCQRLALAADLNGHFLPWLSVSAENSTNTRFRQYESPYYLTDGTKVADDWTDLTDGTIDNFIDIDETGATTGATSVWTGTQSNGAHSTPNNCVNWTSKSPPAGILGTINSLTSTWSLAAAGGCDPEYPIYCFEQ